MLPFCFPRLQLPPPRHLQQRLRFSGGVRCWEDPVTLFLFFSLFSLIPFSGIFLGRLWYKCIGLGVNYLGFGGRVVSFPQMSFSAIQQSF
ncbi:MAG: hypothetical protein EWV40_04640 [Microcystis flos-aquae Mf_WU_F_19750830_S460]|uniref:Uncharacterized protein n=1 Tax=Microcystis flos-aquae Mf_WU_F_19750830_S460 TaxID=2486237 RepID=A0A552LZI0_9CHRO|nr:MAG: hypothetical protein EWV40_04640 [Microcystis flos-aquae Mf_WU_F_19750830_S460]